MLKPRFHTLVAPSPVWFYITAGRLNAGEFKQVTGHAFRNEAQRVEQQRKIAANREITIDTTIAGGYDPTVGKNATISYNVYAR